jgi:hypothetical protein
MRVHLGGWQRTGIVASVLWVIVAGVAARDADLRRASNWYDLSYRTCTRNEPARSNYDFSDCERKATQTYDVFLEHSWADAALIAFGPIPLFWLLAYLVVGIWRWVKRGF